MSSSNNFAIVVTGTLSTLTINSGYIAGAVWFGYHTLKTGLASEGKIKGNVNIYPNNYLKYYYNRACYGTVYDYSIEWRYTNFLWWETWYTQTWTNIQYYHISTIVCNGSVEQSTTNNKIGFFDYTQTEGTCDSKVYGKTVLKYYYAVDNSVKASLANWGGKTSSSSWPSYTANNYSSPGKTRNFKTLRTYDKTF